MYLRTLGGLALEDTSFSRPKPLLLLAYLALEGPKPRRYLADLFFMDAADRMNSLSRAFSDLRKEAPGSIETDPKKAWTTLKCDALELLNLSENKHYEKSLELYKGSFAIDYKLELSEELSEWLYGTREILAAKARNAFLISGEQEASKGNFSQAAFLAEKAYKLREASELEPDDFGRVYNLLYAGHSPLAAEVKQEAESFEIPLELTREEAKAQFETSESIQEIPNNLPLAKTTFVGRDQELIEIAQQLAKPECRLLTLHGMGGIGKSRTAIQVAYDQVQGTRGILSQVEGNPLFQDGVYFIALDALTSADMIPSAIAEVLDFEMQGIDDVLTQVQKYIGKKRILLILDNFEHLMDGATLPSTLLSSCPNLKLIVTTREVLKLEEEWVKNLEGLHYPSNTNLALEEAQGYEAIQLFIQRAKRVMLEFSMTEDNMPTIVEICQLVEGAPLALELAAVWVRVMTLEDIVKEIKENLNFLESQSRNGSERHRSIRAVFEHSWKLLSLKEQEVFRKLSVFVGSFAREAAAEVAGATLPVLASLVNKSLLRVMANGRYSRHFLIYEFSQEKLKDTPEELEKAQEKHAVFYLDYLSGQSEAILGAGQKEVLERLEVEIDNIYVAWPKFFEAKNYKLLNLGIDTLSEFLTMKGRAKEGINLFLLTLDIVINQNNSNTLVMATLAKRIGWLYRELGNLIKAQEYAEQSLSLLQNSSYTHELGRILRVLGIIHSEQGNYTRAESLYKDELEIYKSENDLLSLGITLNNLGFLYTQLGQYKEAEVYLLESIRIAKQHSSFGGLVANLDSLATLYLVLQMPTEAELVFRESLEIAQNINYVWYVPLLLNGLAKALYLQGKQELATENLQKALKRAKAIRNKQALLCILTSLAMVKLDSNEFIQVSNYLMQALSISRSIDAKSDLLFCLLEATKYLRRQGNIELSILLAKHIANSPFAWKVTRDAARELQYIDISKKTGGPSQAKADIVKSNSLEELIVEILELKNQLDFIGSN